MDRRLFLTALTALAAPSLALAAQKDPVKLAKAFPYLDHYWQLPAAERNRFILTFGYNIDNKPAPGVRAWIIDGGTRTPVSFSRDGVVTRLPTLAQLDGADTIQFDVPADANLKPRFELHPTAPVATQIDAHDLQASLTQAAGAVKKMAGAMAFAVPKIAAVLFPGAESGKAMLPDGRAIVLGTSKYGPIYDPAKQAGAKTIVLAKLPSRLLLVPAA